jgi:hypothetical protein
LVVKNKVLCQEVVRLEIEEGRVDEFGSGGDVAWASEDR